MKSTNTKQNIIKINAEGKVLGRIATDVAIKLRGKDKADFAYNRVSSVKVTVYNAAKIIVTGQKMKQKTYYKHTGYLGNLKEITMEKLFEKDPKRVLEYAVKGMLPKNRLQNEFLKNLTIYNGDLNAK